MVSSLFCLLVLLYPSNSYFIHTYSIDITTAKLADFFFILLLPSRYLYTFRVIYDVLHAKIIDSQFVIAFYAFSFHSVCLWRFFYHLHLKEQVFLDHISMHILHTNTKATFPRTEQNNEECKWGIPRKYQYNNVRQRVIGRQRRIHQLIAI